MRRALGTACYYLAGFFAHLTGLCMEWSMRLDKERWPR